MTSQRQGRLRPKPIAGSGMLPAAEDEAPAGRPGHLQVAPATTEPPQAQGTADGQPAPARQHDADLAESDRRAAEPVPAGDLAADKTRQQTVLIAIDVRDRFNEHLASLRPRPTNTALVNAALQAAVGRFAELIQARKPQAQPGVLFGGPASGRRRTTTEARRTMQLAFYPTYGEADLLKQIAEENGTSISGVVEAALDDYLPSAEELAKSRSEQDAGPGTLRR